MSEKEPTLEELQAELEKLQKAKAEREIEALKKEEEKLKVEKEEKEKETLRLEGEARALEKFKDVSKIAVSNENKQLLIKQEKMIKLKDNMVRRYGLSGLCYDDLMNELVYGGGKEAILARAKANKNKAVIFK